MENTTTEIKIKVKMLDDTEVQYPVKLTDEIDSLLKKIGPEINIEPDQLRLYPVGYEILKHRDYTFQAFGIKDGDVMELSKRIEGKHVTYVKCLDGSTLTLATDVLDKVRYLKKLINKEKEEYPVEEMNIAFAGKYLDDRRTLADYGMQTMSTAYMILKKKE